MNRYEEILKQLEQEPKRWLVTGVAGFIGSNLLEALLHCNQFVTGLDNFSTGNGKNLIDVKSSVGEEQWSRFKFIKGDIRVLDDCERASSEADFILHEAALGSVPRSLEDPIRTNENNIAGTLNMLVAARDNEVKRMVYAASSSAYGDHSALPKVEDKIGRPLSPYAVTKYVNELYAHVFVRCYGLATIGLRYFNVFGRRQDPEGAYAAVIPRWIGELLDGKTPIIYGDGETSRDFCYIENVVQANVLAATTENKDALDQVYNVAVGDRTTLNEMFRMISDMLGEYDQNLMSVEAVTESLRVGDVRHSQADISKAKELLGYNPSHTVEMGLKETVEWFVKQKPKRYAEENRGTTL